MKREKATTKDYPAIISLWEKSVLATHDFLTEEDRREIKIMLPTYLKELAVQLWSEDELIGFSAINNTHLEMLFLDPSKIKKGYGKQILQTLIQDDKIQTVDVNRDNLNASDFYFKNGFSLVSESETDGEGRPYPILHLSLEETSV